MTTTTTNSNGVSFTETPATGGLFGTPASFSIADGSGTIVPTTSAGVLGPSVTFLTGGTEGSLGSLLSTNDFIVGPNVDETFSAGLLSLGSTTNFYVGGTLNVTGAAVSGLSSTNIYVYGGTLTADSGAALGALSGWNITIADGGSLDGSSGNLISALSGSSITFDNTHGGGTIIADATGSGAVINLLSGATVTGFNTGSDKIDFQGAGANSVASYSIATTGTGTGSTATMSFFDASNNLIGEATVDNSAGQFSNVSVAQGQSGPLTVTEDASGTGFTVGAAASTLVCYVTGSRILTTRGEVAVENLEIGDLAITASGEERPIMWIGHRTVHLPTPDAYPIRVQANAFGDSLPRRDLWLSPGHAVCVNVMDEVFMPIGALVNGATISPVAVEEVTYWHVELESHDVLVAEGLPAESYLNVDNRDWFGRAHGLLAANDPVKVGSPDDYARPLVTQGPAVEAVRQRLVARAEALGWTRAQDLDVRLLADGVVIAPEIDGATARYTLPAGAMEARLCSRTFIPAARQGYDYRALGVRVDRVQVGDTKVSLDAIRQGFHPEEGRASCGWRWTTGDLVLPAELWADRSDEIILSLTLECSGGSSWIAPSHEESALQYVKVA